VKRRRMSRDHTFTCLCASMNGMSPVPACTHHQQHCLFERTVGMATNLNKAMAHRKPCPCCPCTKDSSSPGARRHLEQDETNHISEVLVLHGIAPRLLRNMTSSAKPEVRNILHRRRKGPSYIRATAKGKEKFGEVRTCGSICVQTDRETDRRTNRQTDEQVHSSQYFGLLNFMSEVTCICLLAARPTFT